MNYSGLWLLVGPVGITAAYLYYSQWDRKRRLSALANLLDGGSGEIRARFISTAATLTGRFRGRDAQFYFNEGSRSSPARFQITLSSTVPIDFEITREGVGEKIAKVLHVRRDIQTGDPELDQQFVFSSSWPEALTVAVASPQVRGPIQSLLLSRGMNMLSCRCAALSVMRTVIFSKGVLQPDKVQPVMEDLDALARALEATTVGSREFRLGASSNPARAGR